MSKTSTIKSLLVVPLIASSILLASPALAANASEANKQEVRQTNKKQRHVLGTVTDVQGSSFTITTKQGDSYTVDGRGATIMKASTNPKDNPDIVTTRDITIGDVVVIRGRINDDEIIADKIFESKMHNMHKGKKLGWFKHK